MCIRDRYRAIYFHTIPTNREAHHGVCPKGKDSWCTFKSFLSHTKVLYLSARTRMNHLMVLSGTAIPKTGATPKTDFVGIETLTLSVHEAMKPGPI